jgi:hypothetical protein
LGANQEKELMDLRAYYQKIKNTEALLTGNSLVVVSIATPEGGKDGVRTEVPRIVAARLLVEGRARVATEDETIEFHIANCEAREKFDREETARRVQVMVIPSPDLRKSKERS